MSRFIEERILDQLLYKPCLPMNVSIVHFNRWYDAKYINMVNNFINKTIVSFFSMSSPEKNPKCVVEWTDINILNKTLVNIIFFSSLIFEK